MVWPQRGFYLIAGAKSGQGEPRGFAPPSPLRTRCVRGDSTKSSGGSGSVAMTILAEPLSPGIPNTTQTSRGQTDRLHRTPAGFTTPDLDGRGLRGHWPARPARQASYPVPVHRVCGFLLHASFRPRLAATPSRFADPSPPSGWTEDLHLRAVGHARHIKKRVQRHFDSHRSSHRNFVDSRIRIGCSHERDPALQSVTACWHSERADHAGVQAMPYVE